MPHKAIETFYAGYHFRSRLEARWAVVFDRLGIAWQYEVEGFQIESAHGHKSWWYLPDFYLPDFNIWVEVKGLFAEVSDDYLEMLYSCVEYKPQLPGLKRDSTGTDGLLILGPIPDVHRVAYTPRFVLMQHSAGVSLSELTFTEGGIELPHIGADMWTPDSGVAPLINANPGPYNSKVNNAFTSGIRSRFEHGQKGA